jgi:hypothetical protein
MFALVDFEGRGLTRAYAETRARLEPVYEVTQIKGDGEAHSFLSPNDEFAGFEVGDKGNIDLTAVRKPEMLQYEYARSGLKLGLRLEQELGVNLFKFGMIGSTDSHTSLATADQDNFFGKHSGAEPSPTRATHEFLVSRDGTAKIMGWEQVASGYAAVWATENTRTAIFDALERKEVYGTTGPRMIVRFFGGFDFRPDDATDAEGGADGRTAARLHLADLVHAEELRAAPCWYGCCASRCCTSCCSAACCSRFSGAAAQQSALTTDRSW